VSIFRNVFIILGTEVESNCNCAPTAGSLFILQVHRGLEHGEALHGHPRPPNLPIDPERWRLHHPSHHASRANPPSSASPLRRNIICRSFCTISIPTYLLCHRHTSGIGPAVNMRTSPQRHWLPLFPEHYVLMLKFYSFPFPYPSLDQLESLFFLPITVQPLPQSSSVRPQICLYLPTTIFDHLIGEPTWEPI
jgi:hypothetical protein